MSVPAGQEGIIESARRMIESYSKDRGREFVQQLQALVHQILPMLPELANALATHRLVRDVIRQYKHPADVPEDIWELLYEELNHPPLGRA